MRVLFLILFLMFVTTTAYSVEAEKLNLIDELLVVTKAEELFLKGQYEGFRGGFEMNAGSIPREKKNKIYEAADKIMKLEMSWEQVKPEFIKIYDKHYSINELKNVLKLSKDPSFSILFQKQLDMLGPSLRLGLEFGKKMTPSIVKAVQSIMQEK